MRAHASLRHRKSQGFTLTELAIVLGVMGAIIASIWTAASIVNEKSRLTTAINQFQLVTRSLTSLMQGGYGVSGTPCAAPCDVTTQMITAKVIPDWAKTGAGTASNPWNNTGFTIRYISTAPLTFRVSFYGVESGASCDGLVMAATNCTAGRPGCPVMVRSGGKPPPTYTDPTVSFNTSTGAMTSTVAHGTICAANDFTGGAVNSVEFDFTQ